MSDTILTAIIGGIAGLLSGTIASLIAPWVQWGIEKRKLRLNRRRELIDHMRQFLSGRIPTRDAYRQSPSYGAIRPYLSQRVQDIVQQRNTSGSEEILKADILQEIAELETKWKLI